MVYYSDPGLNAAFAALADPTRRAIVERLAEESGLAITQLAEPFAVSLPAVMKHLDVLARAKLIVREKSGRTVRCRLTPAPMQGAIAWLSRYQRFWTERLDALAIFVEDDACRSPDRQVLASNARSRRPRKRSSRRGRSRKP